MAGAGAGSQERMGVGSQNVISSAILARIEYMTFSAQPRLWSALIMRNIGGQKVISLDLPSSYSMVCLEKWKTRIFAIGLENVSHASLGSWVAFSRIWAAKRILSIGEGW